MTRLICLGHVQRRWTEDFGPVYPCRILRCWWWRSWSSAMHLGVEHSGCPSIETCGDTVLPALPHFYHKHVKAGCQEDKLHYLPTLPSIPDTHLHVISMHLILLVILTVFGTLLQPSALLSHLLLLAICTDVHLRLTSCSVHVHLCYCICSTATVVHRFDFYKLPWVSFDLIFIFSRLLSYQSEGETVFGVSCISFMYIKIFRFLNLK